MTTLFLPGTLCDERIWLQVWKHLPGIQRRYVPLQWANTLQDMLALTSDRASTDNKVHLVGFSMGGYIAALWALTYPEKVASLSVIGYAPSGLSPDELTRRQQLLSMLRKGKFTDQSRYLANMISPGMQHRLLPFVTAMAEDLGQATLLAHISSTTPRKDIVSKLATLPSNIHFIAADNDSVVSLDSMRQASSRLNKGTLTILKDCGHMMPLEQPEQLANIIASHR